LESGTATTDDKVTIKDPEQFEVVFVNRSGYARQIKVKTGIQDNTNIEIVEGLQPEDEIIIAPYGMISKTLKDSVLIEVVKMDDLYKVKK
jgi:HlyD family secretion protein